MNSYNIFRDYNGYLGLDINDGEVNYKEDIFYKIKPLTEQFLLSFPSKESYDLLNEYYDEILSTLTGEEFARIEEILEKDLGIRIYNQVPYDYEFKKKVYLRLFLDLMATLDKTDFYNLTLESQIKILASLLSRHSFILPVEDKDIMSTLVNNVLNWYIGE